ncbi:MAG: hypothetical protein H7228_05575 [Polaromonas sp.]|nr:hypothetical protein [Polaromonas sp.]
MTCLKTQLAQLLAPPPDTSRVGGVAPHRHDGAILAALKAAWLMPADDLISCEIGVRNLKGEVYRRAAVKGVAQMLVLEEHLEALGFIPELEDTEHLGSGFDAIFRDRQNATQIRPLDYLASNVLDRFKPNEMVPRYCN